jgi:hypothetical protein
MDGQVEGVLATVLDFGEQLQQLWHFAHGIEQHLEQRLVELRRVGEAEGWWHEEYFTEIIGGTFPRFLRYSVILAIYSITEGTLTEICGFVQRHRQIPAATQERRGSVLSQRVKYLSRSLGEQFTIPDRVQHLATVRDCIAHANGDLLHSKDRQRVESAVQVLRLHIAHDRIVVPFEACAPLAQTALDWLNSIVAAVDPRL